MKETWKNNWIVPLLLLLLAAVCLPTGPLPAPSIPVRTPILNTSGGLSPTLLELCDVLPVSSFDRASLD